MVVPSMRLCVSRSSNSSRVAMDHGQQQQNTHQQGTLQQSNDQLQAYQRKWDEELEGFKKLAAKLQGQPGCAQQGSKAAAGGSLPPAHLQGAAGSPPDSDTSCFEQLAAAVHQAEAILQEVHAAAVKSLLSGAADKLVAKQLRLQRNQAFEKAKALLLQAGPALV